jgi:hypothetical protein
MTKLDMTKWAAARKEIEERIREMKTRRGESRQPCWKGWRDGPAFLAARAEATTLYAIRAHARGRLHAPKLTPTMEEQGKRIEKALPGFLRAQEPVAPAAAAG